MNTSLILAIEYINIGTKLKKLTPESGNGNINCNVTIAKKTEIIQLQDGNYEESRKHMLPNRKNGSFREILTFRSTECPL